MSHAHDPLHPGLPTLRELGGDLVHVTSRQKAWTLLLPFVAMGCYALFAWLQWWPLAVAAVMGLSFITYGSSSHDLVHRVLGLPHRFNDFTLSLIELLSLRSGTAYRLSHLHHHQHLLANDDLEGSVAFGSLFAAIMSGPSMQIRLWQWAWRNDRGARSRLLVEAAGILALIAGAVAALPWTVAPLVYVTLVIAGSWIFPVITVYIPHNARGQTPLTQTRLFRGWLARLIAFDHLYHLEHHLYPAVPHHHWKSLADRLDPYLEQAGVKPATAAHIRRGR